MENEFGAQMFAGLKVLESVWLTEAGEPYKQRRSWRERLFSRPWRPFVATRTVVPQVPYNGAVQIDAHTIVLHPATLRKLKAQFQLAAPGR